MPKKAKKNVSRHVARKPARHLGRKPFPDASINSLRRAVRSIGEKHGKEGIIRFLKSLDIADNRPYRKNLGRSSDVRVRKMLLGNKTVIIKLVELSAASSGKATIKAIKEKVRRHNRTVSQKDIDYILVDPPVAYDLGFGLIAMEEIRLPPVTELLSFDLFDNISKTRGKEFLGRLEKKGKLNEKQLKRAVTQVIEKTGIMEKDLVFLGVRKGKPVFMPFIDLI